MSLAFASLPFDRLQGQSTASFDSVLAPHRSAMAALKLLDGVWRGPGWALLPSGEKTTFTQTIRVGAGGEGALRVIEGRSYEADGRLSATSFEIVSYNAATKAYSLRLYAQANAADVAITPNGSGFTLEYPAGGATVRFTISVANGRWHEVADRSTPGQVSVRFLELSLQRLGNTDWPAAGTVPAK